MSNYWKEREAKHIDDLLKRHAGYEKEIHRMYLDLWEEIQDDLEKFYSVYAGKEKISITEAKKRVDKHDVEKFAAKAAKYVKDRDLSPEANKQLRLYNLTMRVNRLELLKSQIGLRMTAKTDELQKYFAKTLTADAISEFKRQAGILGQTVLSSKHYGRTANAIVKGSYHNATFSQRLWSNQDILKSELDRTLTKCIIAGKSPEVAFRDLKPLVALDRLRGKETADYVARRLLASEASRIQTSVQQKSFEDAGIEEYDFIEELTACAHCKETARRGPYRVEDMMPGENASPMHNWCRCSAVPRYEKVKAKLADQSAEYGRDKRTVKLDTPPFDFQSMLPTFTRLFSNAAVENAYIQTAKGEAYEVEGGKHNVFFSGVPEEALRGSQIIHNHPNNYGELGGSFSREDMQMFFDQGLKNLYAVDGEYLYRIWYNGTVKASDFSSNLWRDAELEVWEDILQGKTLDAVDQKHEILKRLSKRLEGLNYERANL